MVGRQAGDEKKRSKRERVAGRGGRQVGREVCRASKVSSGGEPGGDKGGGEEGREGGREAAAEVGAWPGAVSTGGAARHALHATHLSAASPTTTPHPHSAAQGRPCTPYTQGGRRCSAAGGAARHSAAHLEHVLPNHPQLLQAVCVVLAPPPRLRAVDALPGPAGAAVGAMGWGRRWRNKPGGNYGEQ